MYVAYDHCRYDSEIDLNARVNANVDGQANKQVDGKKNGWKAIFLYHTRTHLFKT